MNRFKIKIGDPSDDGHGKYEDFIIESNYTVATVRNAYKESCKLTGIQFSYLGNNNHIGIELTWNNSEFSDRAIAAEYESRTLSKLATDILIKFDLINNDNYEDDQYYIEDTYDFVHILLNFIKLSLPEFNYRIVSDNLEVLNSGDLNVQFGYGLYY